MKLARPVIWGAILLVGTILFVRTFFLRVYYVDSPSMEPALHGAPEGGDSVLVAYGGADGIQRHDMVVILPDGESEPLVKRVAGLPGELVLIRNGDLWIDGELVRDARALPVPVLIFDDELHDLTHDFRMVAAWSRGAAGWQVDAREIERGAMAGCLYMALGLKDHYLAPGGERVYGHEGVGDALLECQVRVDDPGFVVHLGLVEQGDVFELLVDTSKLPRATATLLRNHEELETRELDWAPGSHELRFSNVNNRLLFDLDGTRVFSASYDSNRLFALDTARIGLSPPTDRVFIGGHVGVGVFSGIRVFRDLHYTPRGDFAIEEAVELGPSEMFLLGDNSRESRDGRDWGPTPLSTVIGRPIGVVWPPSRGRKLSGGGAGKQPVVDESTQQ